jgi:hypothetical protein
MLTFRWNDWNLDHVTRHGVSVIESENVIRRASPPWPHRTGVGKWMVEGRGQGDRPIRVVYLIDPDKTIYIIHAMPLTTRRRRRSR